MRRILAGAVAVAALLGGPAHARQAQTPTSTLAQACEGKDGWNDPAPPAHLFGNVYYVGTCGITSLLVTSQQGHVLLDGAAGKAGPLIARMRLTIERRSTVGGASTSIRSTMPWARGKRSSAQKSVSHHLVQPRFLIVR